MMSVTNEKIENFNTMLSAKDKQLDLVSIERDSYRRTNELLSVDVKKLTEQNIKLNNSNKMFKNIAIGSTTIVIGGSILILLLK